MAEKQITTPPVPQVVIPPVFEAAMSNPDLAKRMARLLDAQIANEEYKAAQIAEQDRLKEQDHKARLQTAVEARQQIEARKIRQSRCSHIKSNGVLNTSALTIFTPLPDPKTQEVQMQALCSRCFMVDTDKPDIIKAKYEHIWPNKASIGSVTVETDY